MLYLWIHDWQPLAGAPQLPSCSIILNSLAQYGPSFPQGWSGWVRLQYYSIPLLRLSSSRNNIAMHFEGSMWTLWHPYLTGSLTEHLRKAFKSTSNGVSRFCVWVALKLIEGQSSLLNTLQISIAGKVLHFCIWIFQPSPADVSCPGSQINYPTSKHLKISTPKFHFRMPFFLLSLHPQRQEVNEWIFKKRIDNNAELKFYNEIQTW